ncbi:MAG TPA: radical SAM protein [Phycisphaerales bacterium]|nr:radical SAM protein [Phycisphaerales bacterium]
MKTPVERPQHSGTDPGLLAAVAAGEARLTPDQCLELLRASPTHTMGRWADAAARRLHGDAIRTYIIDRNINYTNVCNAKCTFCAFKRNEGDADAYTLSYDQIHHKIAELEAIGGTQILMQGGMNPALPLDWYLKLLRSIKEKFPRIHVHAFSPPEMVEFVHFFDPPGSTFEEKVRWVMVRLKDAGLDSLPGGGGEIFAPAVRQKIGLGKCDAESWLTVMYVAHSLGMFTSATMMFGHIEGLADRVHHMLLVRKWQDRALREGGNGATDHPLGDDRYSPGNRATDHWLCDDRCSPAPSPSNPGTHSRDRWHGNGNTGFGHYVSFISWPFQRENTPLGRVPDWGADPAELTAEFPGDAVARAFNWGDADPAAPRGQRSADFFDTAAMDKVRFPTAHLFGKRVKMSGSTDYLRTQAAARLFLDNIYSIGSSWVTMGPHIGQVGLTFGATDMGSVMMEENVVSSAGTTYCLDQAVLCRLIRDAGFIPAQRNNTYDVLRTHDGPDSPDLKVTDWSAHRARKLHKQSEKPASQVALTVSR